MGTGGVPREKAESKSIGDSVLECQTSRSGQVDNTDFTVACMVLAYINVQA